MTLLATVATMSYYYKRHVRLLQNEEIREWMMKQRIADMDELEDKDMSSGVHHHNEYNTKSLPRIGDHQKPCKSTSLHHRTAG